MPDDVPIDVVPSPDREVIAPPPSTITKRRTEHPGDVVTVMLPEVVPRRWWQEPLRNQTGLALKVDLLYVVVTGRVRATGKETGRSMDAPFSHVFTVRDGKITKLLNFHDTGRWLHVLGRQP